MIKNLFSNWKTSAAGITMIALAVVHHVFMLKAGTADETSWTRTITAVIGGIGLISAGDASRSKQDVDSAKADVKTAITTGDTSVLDAPAEPPKAP